MLGTVSVNTNHLVRSPYLQRARANRSNPTTNHFSLTPTLEPKNHSFLFKKKKPIELISKPLHLDQGFANLIAVATEGLPYFDPELCDEGVNGTYFLKDQFGRTIAVFKPQDEEANSESNPKREREREHFHENSDMPYKGIRNGEAAQREVAAYLLDRDSFSCVPKTHMVEITHKFNRESNRLETKKGSLQEFIDNDGCSEDFGPSTFPVTEVHKIGILDIRIFNTDRHTGNILVRRKNDTLELVPIDQGFSLPESLDSAWLEWMHWPQTRVPFDDETKLYISRIDVDKDIKMLQRELGIRPECLKTMKISTTLLKKCALHNLTLHDVAHFICRRNLDQPSALEKMCDTAKMFVAQSCPATKAEEETMFYEFLFALRSASRISDFSRPRRCRLL